jgi:hypothetical protein
MNYQRIPDMYGDARSRLPASCRSTAVRRLGHLAVAGVLFAISTQAAALISPEDHAKHHPNPGQPGPPAQPGQPVPADPMAAMAGMMQQMHAPPPKELYPKLMSVPELTPAARE